MSLISSDAATRISNTPFAKRRNRVLRGGRMVKTARGIASFAPLVVSGIILSIGAGKAHAANECGTYTGPNDAISCTTGTYSGTDPIVYADVDGLVLTLDDAALDLSTASAAVSVSSDATSANNILINALNFGTITTTGGNGFGLAAQHSGDDGNAEVILYNGDIVTSGDFGFGIYSHIINPESKGDAIATMNGGSHTLTGANSRGVYTRNQGLGNATSTLNGGTITTSGLQGWGVFARIQNTASSGTVTAVMNDGIVDTRWNDETNIAGVSGIYALTSGTGSVLAAMNNGQVITLGEASHGVFARSTNTNSTATITATMNDGTVATSGDVAHGLYALQQGSGSATIIIDESANVTTKGSGAIGAYAFSFGFAEVAMDGGNIIAKADGIRAVGSAGYEVQVSHGNITSGGGQSASIRTVTGGNDGTVNIGDDAIIDGSASGIAIRDGDFNADSTDENPGDVVVTASGTVTGDAVLGLGDDVFNLTGGIFDGDIYGDDAATAGMTLAEMVTFYDGVYTEEQLRGIDPVNPVGQDDTFNWTGGVFGSSFFGGNGSDTANITSSTYDGTYHVLDGGDDYSTTDGWIDVLTLSGDVSGDINGANVLNWERVNLDGVQVSFADGALQVGADPSSGLFLSNGTVLDQSGVGLTLTGNMSNAAILSLQNGSVGDVITVDGDYAGAMGVLQLDVDTATDAADTLTVTGDSSGATGILVNNISPNTATGNDITLARVEGTSSDGDFVLANGPVTGGAFQYDLEYQTGDFVLTSMMSSTGAVFDAASYVLLDGITRMPTLEQRVGQRRWNSAAGTLEPTSGGWIRIHGDWSEADLDTGTSYDVDTWGLQTGFDIPAEPSEDGQWVLGLTAQTGKTSAGIATMTGTGSINSESLGFGATATWYGYNDLYVDLQGQVNWAGVDYNSSLHGVLAEDELVRTAAASIEVGRRYALDENRGLIPQAQLTWASVDGGRFTDSVGNVIDLGTNERVTGRLGLAYDYEWRDEEQGSMQNVYGIVNILHDFSSDASVDVAGVTLASEREATWGEIGLGGSVTWDETTTFYAEASYREAFGSDSGNGVSVNAGLRVQW